jgi:hypothetical protein
MRSGVRVGHAFHLYLGLAMNSPYRPAITAAFATRQWIGAFPP